MKYELPFSVATVRIVHCLYCNGRVTSSPTILCVEIIEKLLYSCNFQLYRSRKLIVYLVGLRSLVIWIYLEDGDSLSLRNVDAYKPHPWKQRQLSGSNFTLWLGCKAWNRQVRAVTDWNPSVAWCYCRLARVSPVPRVRFVSAAFEHICVSHPAVLGTIRAPGISHGQITYIILCTNDCLLTLSLRTIEAFSATARGGS